MNTMSCHAHEKINLLATKGTKELGRFKVISSVQFSRSVVSDSVTTQTEAYQESLYITNSRSLLKLMSIELVMPFNHLILCHTLLLLPSIFLSIRVFSNELALHIKFSFSISPAREYSRLSSFN